MPYGSWVRRSCPRGREPIRRFVAVTGSGSGLAPGPRQRSLVGLILFLLLLIPVTAGAQAAPARPGGVLVVDLKGAIGVAAARQVARAIERARQDKAAAIVLRLDTPGGLVTSTREIIREMVAAPVPVIVYVAPSGARAASAGTFIVYAGHIAAMAPGTNLGAATPIELGGHAGHAAPRRGEEQVGQPEHRRCARRPTTRSRCCARSRRCAGTTPNGPRRRCAMPRR